MDSWVWDQVSLELSDIDVKGTIESEGGGKRGDNLSDESVQVGVGWSLNIEVSSADIINGFVIDHDSDISVLKEGVGGENGVVWLNNGGGDLWGWVDGESELGFFTVVNGKSLEEEGTETGTGTTTDGVEDEETLETCALVSKFSDSVEAEINDFLTNGVVSSGEVVGGILLAGDQLLRVEELSVGASSDLIDDGWLEINEDGSWNVLSSASLGEEGVEGVVAAADGLVGGHLAVRLDAMLEAVELPACGSRTRHGVSDKSSGL